jgi:FlaG/FlaF family flagellin (archaellin)
LLIKLDGYIPLEVRYRAMKAKTKKAVAPVLATLLMIAVAVSMSVIIFMWGQGFLSQTSEGTGAQQGAQNQAAQSSISVEAVLFEASTSKPNITVVVRNVGAVAIELGSITVTGVTANSGFKGSLMGSIDTTFTLTASSGSWSGSATATSISKGNSATITLNGTTSATDDTVIQSGDIVTIKVTTRVGTFAQASFTVP